MLEEMFGNNTHKTFKQHDVNINFSIDEQEEKR
jgi:hypothetical protein